ncbi:MAG: GerMN domain-containing protein [Peptostreptococcaceae bacterium]|nr:GerMN domain-containing protein [Peptostreptococcaceae bacterium]
MKKLRLFIVFMLSVFILTSCNMNQEKQMKTREIKLFYPNNDGTEILWMTRPIDYIEEDEKYDIALNTLINGPYSLDMSRAINEKTKINSIKKDKEKIIVDLSKDFLKFGNNLNEINAIVTLTNTLTQFEEIDEVKLTVDSKKVISSKGIAYENLVKFDLNEEKELIIDLYIPNENYTKLMTKKESIKIKSGEPLGFKVLEKLIEVSNNDDKNLIPKGTKILGYKQNNKIVTINFNKEFVDNHNGGNTGEMMSIYSIVNTLCSLDTIEEIVFEVEGEKKEYYKHIDLSKSFKLNQELIEEKNK